MKDVLEEIIAWKRIEVEQQKETLAPALLYRDVETLMQDGIEVHSMHYALANSASGIIAEFKRKSPSKGWIHPDINPEDVVPLYAAGGASALSILTDEKYFGGCLDFIRRMRPLVQTPILRKEFIIDEYQLFQARQLGADAVLLIAADLKKQEVKSLTQIAHELQLEVLLELHDEDELDYADLDVDMIGINNRHLGTFHTDVQHSFDMIGKLPQDKVLVSESGISTPSTIRDLRTVGYRGFLIGETFMKEDNPGKALQQFIAQI